MSFAKKASDLADTSSLRFQLHQHFSGPEKARPLHNVHASALTKAEGFCPRYYAIHDVTNAKLKNEWLSTSEAVTFAMGHGLQDTVAHAFADMGKAIGDWVCNGCSHRHEFRLRPDKCVKCGCKSMKAEEMRFVSATSGASCGIDLLISRGHKKLLPVEIKTMDKDEFRKLTAPLQEHRLRTTYYLRLIAESDDPRAKTVETQEARILYTSKGGYGCAAPDLVGMGLYDKFSPFKEYVVTRNDKLTDGLHQRAKVVKDFREGKVGMPCGICPTALSKRALGCEFKTKCFSGAHPPEYNWQEATP